VLESRKLRKAEEEAETEGRRQLHDKTRIFTPTPEILL
jgi:hypothetical protein